MKKILCVVAAISALLLVGCASANIANLGDGIKVLSSTSKISEDDFMPEKSGFNFFIRDINYNCSSLNIFSIMKFAIENGKVESSVVEEPYHEMFAKNIKKGEAITYQENSGIIYFVKYNKKTKHFDNYGFQLYIDDVAYENYEENNSYSMTCLSNISSCNEIIAKCSNPTIQKSRIVKVPYTVTERYWVSTPSDIGTRTGRGGFQSTGIENAGHYETRTYTAYKDEIQYYTVPDPNYNPTAVAKAKQDLQYWQSEKNRIDQILEEVPFELYPL